MTYRTQPRHCLLSTSPDATRDSGAESYEGGAVALAGGVRHGLGATVVAHPDAAMIGAFGVLPVSRGPVEISRLTPLFIRTDGALPVPLTDPHVSRRPIRILVDDNGLVIAQPNEPVSARVQGRPLEGPRRFGAAEVDRGIVLRLSRHVALFIHNHGFVPWSDGQFGLAGLSAGMHELREQVIKVARHDMPVLIQGESGVGKELVARALHDASPRANGPYVMINMAAIPASTAASELFGHVRGAFTGAATEHDGFFARANGGTLLLDEIGELSHDVQSMLLRVLETGELQRVGDRRPLEVSVRVIASTDRDIDSPQLAARLRTPLLHRLSGYVLRVPPLRNRKEDIPVLAAVFLQAEQQRLPVAPAGDRSGTSLPCAVVERLLLYNWPGNVRELRNVVRRLAIDGLERSDVELDATLDQVLTSSAGGDTPAEPLDTKYNLPLPVLTPPALRPSAITDDQLVAALQSNRWHISATARQLGIARSSLNVLMDQCAVIRRAVEVPSDELELALAAVGGDIELAAEALQVSPRGLKLRMSGK